MDATSSRKKRPLTRDEWMKSPAIFTEDRLIIAGRKVMEKWETDYMKMLASIVTKNGGNILEIGFGLGIATHFIQQNKKVTSHTILECHPDVIKRYKDVI